MTRLRHHLDAADPVVGDHRIGGMPVLPAAAQIDALLTACDSARPDRQWLLSQVSFLAPLTVTGAGAEVVTTVDGDGQCSVGSRPAGHDGGTGDDWTVHSRARAVSRPLTPPHYLDVAELRASCGDGVPLSAVTRWRESSGIDYGPAFRAIRTAHRGPDRMLTLLRAPQEPAGPHFVPPALLDSLFQCLGMLDDGAAGPCLPWVVGRVAARRPVSGSVLALVERTVPAGGASGIAQGRATVCNQQGEVLLELDRITLKGLPPGEPATRQSVTVAVSPGPPDRPAPEDRPSTTSPAGPPGGQISRTGWRPVVPTAEPTPEQGALLVVAPEDGPVPAWAETGGRPVIRLAMEKLLDEGNGALPQDTTVGEVVCLVPEDLTGPTAATACLRGLFSLVRHLAAHPPMPSLTLVTGAAHDVTGEDTVDPLHTAVWGLARTLRTEHPNTRIRLLDIGRNSDQAPPVAVRFTQPELARRGDGWYEPCLDPVPGPPSPSLPDGGRYLITGGMGGIGLHVAEFLAERGCAHLTLVGRSVPQDGELRQRLDRLAGSCDLAVVRADVRTLPEALRGAGRFDGVFHAAGVLRDGLARSLSGERIDEVFAPKIGGVHALDEAFTPETRPGFVALFSSVSAVHGNLGQSSYATANAYLDGYAARRRSEGEAWYSLGWGLWTVGMGRDIVKGAAARGIPALSAAEGTALLGAVLGLPPAHYVLSATATPKGAQMTAVTPESRLWPVLSTTLRRILQAGDVSPQDNLLEMGLDSMMAVEVAAALASEGLDVDAAVFFEHADVGALLAHLESLPRDISGAAPLSGGQDGTAHRATGHAADAFRIPGQTPGPAPAHTVPASRPPAAAAPVSPGGGRAFVPDWDRYRQEPAPPAERATAAHPAPAPAAAQRPAAGQRAVHRPGPARSPEAHRPAPQPVPGTAVPDGRGTPAPSLAPAGPAVPRRTLPGRLTDLPHGTFLERRIDALSAEDRGIVARNDYFYEPVIEEADGSWITFDGKRFLNFASYSYLGLIGHPYINHHTHQAVERHGTGAHGVRLLAGTLHLHRELELALARFLGTEDAVVFSSGYMANVATVGALVGPDDVIIGDVYNHASILDGYRLSGARVLTYAHNDLADLERALRKAGDAGRLVVTDAVFSMDGDVADLPGIVELCERYDAPLMVDEAHSLGVLGATGRGITEHFGIDPARVPVKMGTLSKTVPSAGGYVAGSSDLVFALKNNARGWMFSAAATPAQVAAAKAAVEVMEAAPALAGELRAKTDRYRGRLRSLGFDTLASETPVVPIVCASAEQAQAMARLCQNDGLFVQPIVYPAVPRALPRLRTIINLSHSDHDLDEAVTTLERAGRRVGLIA